MEPTVVKVSSPADILGVLPLRLGFHPTESLVVISLHGPRRRDELVMRFDLPGARHDAAFADEVVARLRRRGADATVLACYTEAPAPAVGLARAPLFRRLRRELRRADIDVVDALLVRDGRWWSYRCRDESCCPPEGTAMAATLTPAATRYAAEAVAQGSVVLADRDALERSIEPAPGSPDEEVEDEAGRRVAAALAAGGVDALRGEVLALVEGLVARWSESDCRVDPVEALTIAVGLRSKPVRDAVMTVLLDHDAPLLSALFTELARRTSDRDAAPVCTVLAWFAYAAGGGALTQVAAERALRAEPGYALAELILSGLSLMSPPSLVREISARVRADLDAAS